MASIAGMGSPQDHEHMMGTTIMAVTFDGGVVMGADSRTSTGAYVANRVSDKITPVSENVYCCRSGSAADTQAISDYVRTYLAQHEIEIGKQARVKTAATLFQKICYDNKDRLLAGIICAGYDDVDGGSVYSINLGGSCVKQNYTIGGSGSSFIYGFCDSKYKPGMTRDECIEFTKQAVAHAMARDGSSGGVIRLAIIDKDGVERVFIPGDDLPYKICLTESRFPNRRRAIKTSNHQIRTPTGIPPPHLNLSPAQPINHHDLHSTSLNIDIE